MVQRLEIAAGGVPNSLGLIQVVETPKRPALRSRRFQVRFVMSAARVAELELRIMRQTGQKSIEMVLRYIRRANAFTDNATLAVGRSTNAVPGRFIHRGGSLVRQP